MAARGRARRGRPARGPATRGAAARGRLRRGRRRLGRLRRGRQARGPAAPGREARGPDSRGPAAAGANARVNTIARWWAKLRPDASAYIWVLVGLMAAGAVLLYSTVLANLPATFASPQLPWWSLALIFFAAESFPVYLHFRSETHTLSLSELAVVLGLFLATPGALMVGAMVGGGAAFVFVRRQRTLKSAFNIAEFAFSVAVAVIVFRTVAELGS